MDINMMEVTNEEFKLILKKRAEDARKEELRKRVREVYKEIKSLQEEGVKFQIDGGKYIPIWSEIKEVKLKTNGGLFFKVK